MGLSGVDCVQVKRFEQMLLALEEEFETPPPGEAWTEANLTRRMWRKQNAQAYGYTVAGDKRKALNDAKRLALAQASGSNVAHQSLARTDKQSRGGATVSGAGSVGGVNRRGGKPMMSATR